MTMKKKKWLYYSLGIVQLFVSIGAIPAGISMLLRPDGTGLGMTLDLIKYSPFPDFFIPGLFLFTVNGIFHLFSGILSLLKFRYTAVISMGLGFLLIAWIIIQTITIGLISFMQPMFFIIGLIEVILGIIILRKIKTL
jgi:hypothetical protein